LRFRRELMLTPAPSDTLNVGNIILDVPTLTV